MRLKEEIINEEIILKNVAKWLFLSVLAGALTGGLIGLFLIALRESIKYISELDNLRYVLIPVGLLASIYSIRWIAPSAEGHGSDKVISAIHYRASRISFLVVPAKILSTIFTLAPGGVVGTEGPSVQIGAGFTSALSLWFRFTEKERKKLVVCGVAAALSAVLGAPIGGAIFGVEVLYVGGFSYLILLPAVISSIASYFVCSSMGLTYDLPVIVVPAMSITSMSWALLSAVFFSLVCIYHVEMLHFVHRAFSKMKISLPLKSFISSGILLSTVPFWGDTFLGMGEERLVRILSGHSEVWYAFLIKSILLAVTLSGGGSGGVLTPTFYIGAAAGGLFASIFGLDVGFFAALGFVGCIAGAVNTPLAATFLATELFGSEIAPYAGLVCIVSYMLTGLRSLYPTQILVSPKVDDFILAEPNNHHSWQVKRKVKSQKRFPMRSKIKKGISIK